MDAALPGFTLEDLQAFLQSQGFSCAHVQTHVTTAMVRQDITAAVIAPYAGANRWFGWMPTQGRLGVYLWDTHYTAPCRWSQMNFHSSLSWEKGSGS